MVGSWSITDYYIHSSKYGDEMFASRAAEYKTTFILEKERSFMKLLNTRAKEKSNEIHTTKQGN